MADGVQRVRVPGFIVSQVSAMAVKLTVLSTLARSAGVGNSAPKAMLGWRLWRQACPRRRSVGACDEPTDRRGGQAVFAARMWAC